MEKSKLTVFLDAIGRTVIGEKVDETDKDMVIKNPVIVHVTPQQDQTGQVRMGLQLFPLFFKEFLGDKEAGITFRYNKNNISLTTSDVALDWKLEGQYRNIFINQPPQPQSQPQSQPADAQVIKLFDD